MNKLALASAVEYDNQPSDQTVDKRLYRDGMAMLASAVSVVTSAGPGGLSGATVSAVCSVTDEPATLLVCLNQSSRSNSIIKQNNIFCVNVLAGANHAVADVFAGSAGAPVAERFAAVKHDYYVTGAPILEAAAVAFDCEVIQTIEQGTHTIFFGRVLGIRSSDSQDCLMYFGRKYFSVGAAS